MITDGTLTKPLILEKLAIANFRAFQELKIEHFGRVNLIVGKNNVGKTCLLEALCLYASRGAPEVIRQILLARNEFAVQKAGESPLATVKHLFHGRRELSQVRKEIITIGPGDPDNRLSIQIILADRALVEQVEQVLLSANNKFMSQLIEALEEIDTESEIQKILTSLFKKVPRLVGEQNLLLIVRVAEQIRVINESFKQITTVGISEIPSLFISANGVAADQVTQLWRDSVYLTHLQDDVEDALRMIEPNIKNVGLIPNAEEPGHLVPQVRLAGLDDRVLLSSLGEGMNRLFGLALALVNVSNGFLLVDEIGNGIHYSVQPQLWDFIFTMAERLNVQVFATTHSWDAIEAFQQAAQAHQESEGMLISLRNKQDTPGIVVSTLFNEQDLAYVTREQVEVR